MDPIPPPEARSQPGQLYATASGHLFYAGKICIVMVGLPGRGKTNRSERITRYLSWLGVRTRVFHLANYRRNICGPEFRPTPDYYRGHTRGRREQVRDACLEDVLAFYKQEGGQVAVYDAVNATRAERAALHEQFKVHGVECLFVESLVTDEHVLARNIAEVRMMSPDYAGRDPNESIEHYLKHLEQRMRVYEPIAEKDLLYIKLVNDGEQCVVNNGPLGYLLNRVLMFLLNSRRRSGSLFFARAGASDATERDNNGDNDLSARGAMYASTLANTLMGYVSSKQVDWGDIKMDLQQLKRVADHKSQLFASAVPSIAPSVAPSMAPSVVSSVAPSIAPSAAPSIAASRNPSAAPSPQGSRSGSLVPSAATTPSDPPLVVWTSSRRKAAQTAQPFKDSNVPVSHRSLLNQLNPGDIGDLINHPELIKEKFPTEYEEHCRDPYHHRYPRAESYQDVAIRLEPLMMEMERVQSNLLVICNESVMRVLYGFIMGLSTDDIPSLEFPANQIVEIVPNGYSNMVVRIPLAGVSLDGGVEPPSQVPNKPPS